MIDRPDWNFNNDGSPVAPAAPSPDQVIYEMQTQSGPSPETTRALAETTPASTAPVPATRDASGNLVREDWSKKPPQVYDGPARKNWSGNPDWGPQRDEQGKFVSKDVAEMRQQFEREGGLQANVARIQTAETTMLNLSENPQALVAAINQLPKSIGLKAADVMRLSTGYGANGPALKAEQFLNSLSRSEFTEFETWWRKLSRGDQDAILGAISR
jgi:hypothetical protein